MWQLHPLDDILVGVLFTLSNLGVNWLLRAKRARIRRELLDAMMFGPMSGLLPRINQVLNRHYTNRFAFPRSGRPKVAIVPDERKDDTLP